MIEQSYHSRVRQEHWPFSDSHRSTSFSPPVLYARLAAISSDEEADLVVYHQISDDVIVEEYWNPMGHIWAVQNIVILTT